MAQVRSPEEREKAIAFPCFLRYEAPTVLLGLVAPPAPSLDRNSNSNRATIVGVVDPDAPAVSNASANTPTHTNSNTCGTLFSSSHGGHLSIPAAKLAAAKTAARDGYLASQQSMPVARCVVAGQTATTGTAAATGGATRGGGGGASSSHAHQQQQRLPAPPLSVAGRRRPGGASNNNSTSGGGGRGAQSAAAAAANKAIAAGQPTAAARATAATPPPPMAAPHRNGDGPSTCASSAPAGSALPQHQSHPQQQQQQHLSETAAAAAASLSALMRSAGHQTSFVANVLASIFPPRLDTVDAHAATAPNNDHSKKGSSGGLDAWNASDTSITMSTTTNTTTASNKESASSSSTTAAAAMIVVVPVSVQTVSCAPATRDQVTALHDALRERLQHRRAEPTGLCPIRREVYGDVFSEVTRQVAVDEPGRGVLLQWIREEAERSLEVHADLVARGHAFSERKAAEALTGAAAITTTTTKGSGGGGFSSSSSSAPAWQSASSQSQSLSVGALRARLEVLRGDHAAIERRHHDCLVARDALEKRFDNENVARAKLQQDELAYLRRANQQLSVKLKAETEKASPPATAATTATTTNQAVMGDTAGGGDEPSSA